MVAFISVREREKEKSLLKRLKYSLNKRRAEIRQVAVEGGLPFFVLDVTLRKGVLPWAEIEAIIRTNHLRLALPETIAPPPELCLPLFKPDEFPRVIAYRTFLEILSRFKPPAQKRAVGIVDLRGSMVNELAELVELAGDIMIITARPYLYENFREWAMREHGAAVTVSDDISRVEKYKALFLPNALPFEIGGSGGVFSCDKIKSSSRRTLCGSGISLPRQYRSLMPEGYDTYLFAAALYEQCGIKSLERLVLKKIIFKDDEISPYEALSVLGGT